MHIIILGPAYPLRGGGLSTFNERLARAFIAQGHHVQIYTFSLQYPSFLFPGKSQYSTDPAPKDLDIRVKINSVNPLNWWSVGNELKHLKPDMIVVRYWLPFMGPCFGTILRRVKKNKFTKVICIADNIVPHEKRPGDNAFTKFFIKPVDAFITMSSIVMEQLRSFTTTKKATLVPHPLYDNFGEKIESNVARSLLKLEKENFVILFFGFIRQYKGLDLLLDAMPDVIKKIPSAKLVIAGEFYDDAAPYMQQIEDLGITDHIALHDGFIENDMVKNFFCAADVVVQPYKHATQSGVTPLAYHFEIPMILTNVGGLADMIEDGKSGLLAEPNAQDIAKKIIEYHASGKASFLAALIDRKKLLSWDVMVEEIIKLSKNTAV